MMKYILLALSVSVLLLVLFVSPVSMPATAAPVAAPTPVAAVDRGAALPNVFTWFAGNSSIAADNTSACQDLSNYDTVDLYYKIDQGTVNTTTLTLKFGNKETELVSGINIVAANVADANDMQQFQVFGKYMCVYADVGNTNPITITVNALAK
jgi:hypothetical protein